MKKNLCAFGASLAAMTALTACGGGYSGPTYAQVDKDHSKAADACTKALGTDQKKLALLDPGEESSDSGSGDSTATAGGGATATGGSTAGSNDYRVRGEWDDNLVCTVVGPDFHNEVNFSTTDGSSPGDLHSHQGSVYSWVGADSGSSFAGDAQGELDSVTKKLAG